MRENFSVSEILKITGGKLRGKREYLSFFISPSSISTDTRHLKKGELFIALSGEHFDGHNFIRECWKKGACGAIVSKSPPLPSPQFFFIQVKDTLRALQNLAKYNRERLSLKTIGVTGSNGKTTVKEMLSSILSSRYSVLKSEGNFNNQIGVPLSLLKLSPFEEIGILEMGMNSRGEIQRLSEIIQPDIGIITNIHHSHIGFLGSQEEIKEAKAEMIPFLNKDKRNWLILNGDDEWTDDLKKKAECGIFTFGIKNKSDVKAQQIREKENGVEFNLIYKEKKVPVHLNILGIHNVYNFLTASAASLLLGVSLDTITQIAPRLSLPPLRCQMYILKEYKLIDDSYNANPESMSTALELLLKMGKNRKIAILGDMLELGEKAPLFHRKLGEEVGKSGINALFVLGEFSEEVRKGAKEMKLREVFCFKDKEELIKKLFPYLKKGDSLLIKGSRKLRMDEIANRLRMKICSIT
ncbi:MAG: UDP-N-acetylmuramoyl-tripeptide--D-alanyl-D-alanine ligase [Candidatus Aerophobetes bacterium]|nr:UDP-N-acetylmuramoyl-tripeptide--D-alanyl-D-alanine ligase [Candidatus Aerophobetes bacterium]